VLTTPKSIESKPGVIGEDEEVGSNMQVSKFKDFFQTQEPTDPNLDIANSTFKDFFQLPGPVGNNLDIANSTFKDFFQSQEPTDADALTKAENFLNMFRNHA
jgi:hypothetical protein